MKNNKLNMVAALLYLSAGVCFILAGVFHTEIHSKVLFGIAATCLLIAGIGFFCVSMKKRKS